MKEVEIMDEATTDLVTGREHQRMGSLCDSIELSSVEEIDSPASTLEASEPYQSALTHEQMSSGYQTVTLEKPCARRAPQSIWRVDLPSLFNWRLTAPFWLPLVLKIPAAPPSMDVIDPFFREAARPSIVRISKTFLKFTSLMVFAMRLWWWWMWLATVQFLNARSAPKEEKIK